MVVRCTSLSLTVNANSEATFCVGINHAIHYIGQV